MTLLLHLVQDRSAPLKLSNFELALIPFFLLLIVVCFEIYPF